MLNATTHRPDTNVEGLPSGARPDGPITALLLDDHPLIVESFSMLIDTFDDVTLTHASGNVERATAHIEDQPVDVALIDFQLGHETDGIKVTETILSLRPATQVLLLTSYADAALNAAAVRAGASGVLPKSATAARLHEAIRTVAAGGHVQDPALLAGTMDALSRPAPGSLLTVRERQVLQLIAAGETNGTAARTLGISSKTISTHMERSMRKLGVHTRGAAVTRALQLKELDLPS